MAWVWDNGHRRNVVAPRRTAGRRDPRLRRFLDAVDILYYGAAAVLAGCIIVLVAG